MQSIQVKCGTNNAKSLQFIIINITRRAQSMEMQLRNAENCVASVAKRQKVAEANVENS